MTIIRQLLKVKGHGCFSVGPGESVYSAIKKMAEKDVGRCSSWMGQHSSAS